MEQNNFEKNVQQKMDDLKIAPSDSVWANVEKRLGKKDKDRRVVFILFFLIAFLLSGGYWLLNLSKVDQKNNDQTITETEKTSGSKATNKQDLSFAKNKKHSIGSPSNVGSARVLAAKAKKEKVNSITKNEKENSEYQSNLIEESAFEANENFTKQRNNEDSGFELIKAIKPQLLEKENENFDNQSNGNIENKINANIFSNELKSEIAKEKLNFTDDSIKKNDSVKKQKKRWNIGFALAGGESLIRRNLLERSFPVADYNSGRPSGGNPSYYYQPSPIKSSTAFFAGVFIEKNISARGKIAFGLSYKYYSLLNKVGRKVDSLLSPSTLYFSVSNSYNSVNSGHTYRNTFHYLEVPISFKLQLNKNKKLPLSWDAGINLSELLTSNALQFKANPGVYYTDNSMLNKSQFGLHTGISATFFSSKKMLVSFGPYFYYSATSLADNGLYAGKHFSFFGIHTEILFKQK